MKDSISNCDLLLIRECKKNSPSINILRRIISRKCGLTLEYVDKSHIVYHLTKIVFDYNLIGDLIKFITVDLNPKKWWTTKEETYIDNLINELIGIISTSRVSIFPRYPNPAWFRNKYD